MRNIYLADNRVFENEESLIKFIRAQKLNKNLNLIDVRVIEIASDDVSKADKYLASFDEKVIRENKLTKVLSGDSDWLNKVENFKNKFTEEVPEGDSKNKFSEIMNVTLVDKKEFQSLIKTNSVYLIYESGRSVEWYKSILDICNFRKIDDSYISGHGYRKSNVMTPKDKKENFSKAKSIK